MDPACFCARIRRMLTTTTASQAAEPLTQAASKPAGEARYVALDAFRGFIMFVLASEAFGFGPLQRDPTYGRIALWFEHVEWTGAVFWDLIQPSFMFMVGVAMPFALARRTEQGATSRQNLAHVAARAIKLLLLSQFLMIVDQHRVHFQLINVLSQIAFTYFFTFLIMQLKFRWQALTAALLLAAHWALFLLFPAPDGGFSKTGNIGAEIDKAILGYNYPGYYVTINFISSIVTTLFGAWTGTLLRTPKTLAEKFKILSMASLAAFAGGLALSVVNPMVKRLWTASFTLYSTGWVLLMMLAFILLIEVWGARRLAFPFIVVGMNSIFIYSAGFMVRGAIDNWVSAFSGGFKLVGTLAPVIQACAVMVVMWSLCYWLYKRRIFLKL